MMEIREDERQLLASLDHLEDSNASIAVLTQPDALAEDSRKFAEDELTKVAPLLKKHQSRD